MTSFALVLGYLCGLRGKRLLESSGLAPGPPPAEVMELAREASKQGWLSYKAAGSVVEITFPGLLTPTEERPANEPD